MTEDRVSEIETKLATVEIALNLLWTEHFADHYQDPVAAATEYARKVGKRLSSPPISDLPAPVTAAQMGAYAAVRDEMGVFFDLVTARLRLGLEGLDS